MRFINTNRSRIATAAVMGLALIPPWAGAAYAEPFVLAEQDIVVAEGTGDPEVWPGQESRAGADFRIASTPADMPWIRWRLVDAESGQPLPPAASSRLLANIRFGWEPWKLQLPSLGHDRSLLGDGRLRDGLVTDAFVAGQVYAASPQGITRPYRIVAIATDQPPVTWDGAFLSVRDLGQRLAPAAGWSAENGQAAEFDRFGQVIRMWRPVQSPRAGGGLVVQARVDAVRDAAIDESALMDLAFDAQGVLVEAEVFFVERGDDPVRLGLARAADIAAGAGEARGAAALAVASEAADLIRNALDDAVARRLSLAAEEAIHAIAAAVVVREEAEPAR